MKYGYHVSGGDWGGIARLASQWGLSAVQFFIDSPQSFIQKNPGSDLKLVKYKDVNLKTYIHAPYVWSMGSNRYKGAAKALKMLVHIAQANSIDGVVVHSGSWKSLGDWQLLIERWREVLGGWDSRKVLLENMPYKEFGLDSDSLAQIAKSCNCGVCFDTAHWWGSGEPLENWEESWVTPFVKLIHFNNAVEVESGSGHDKHSEVWITEETALNKRLESIVEMFPKTEALIAERMDVTAKELDYLRKVADGR